MSGPRGDDESGRRPPDPDGLPGFPPEWGRVVIPDDASELAQETAKVRRELRRDLLFRRYGLRSSRRLRHLALPIVLLIMAVLVATTSLFAAVWPTGQTQGGKPATDGRDPSSTTSGPDALRVGDPLPDLILIDASGTPVTLRDAHPAVILLTRQCACAGLIGGTARAAAGSGVPVLVVGAHTRPALPSPAPNVRIQTMTDPNGVLSNAVAGAAAHVPDPRSGAALLVDAKGKLVTLVPASRTADDFAAKVPALVG